MSGKSILPPFQEGRNRCLLKWIFRRIRQGNRLVVGYILDAKILEHFEKSLAHMVKSHCSMVGITLLYEHMTIETPHLRDSKHTDTTKRTRRNIKHFALCNIGTQIALCVTLQPIESHLAGCNVALKRATGKVWLSPLFQKAVLNELIFNGTCAAHLAFGRVSTVEPMKVSVSL